MRRLKSHCLAIGCMTLTVVGALLPTTLEAQADTANPKDVSKTMTMQSEQEVLDLHAFFQDWFQGLLPKTDESFARFADVMDPDFHIISPAGRLTSIKDLGPGLRGVHGKWRRASNEADASRIWIENIQVHELAGDLALVTYEEWQVAEGPAKGRLSTAVFRRDPQTPNGVRWLHVHETWLPADDE